MFNFIGGGIFPPNFLVKNTFDYQNKKLIVQTINLNPLYKKKDDFNETDLKKYINEEKNGLKEEFISFRFAPINPTSLVDSEEFNELFFKKIDEIDNLIINGRKYDEIAKKYNLNVGTVKLVNKNGENESGNAVKNISPNLLEKIAKLKSKKTKDINLIEFETEYVLLVIDEIKNVIPNITSENFKRKIYRRLIERDILYQNTKLIEKIKVGSFKE